MPKDNIWKDYEKPVSLKTARRLKKAGYNLITSYFYTPTPVTFQGSTKPLPLKALFKPTIAAPNGHDLWGFINSEAEKNRMHFQAQLKDGYYYLGFSPIDLNRELEGEMKVVKIKRSKDTIPAEILAELWLAYKDSDLCQ